MQTLSSQDLEIIARCTLFRGLCAKDVVPLLDGNTSSCPEGQFLIQEGERIDRLWILLSGTLHASRYEPNGQEFLYQQILPSYMAGGEVSCTPRKTSPYDIYAASDCRLWSFYWERIDSPSLPPKVRLTMMKNMLTFVSNQNIRKYYKIEALSVKGARERILKYLTAQAIRAGSRTFTIFMDRESMANYLCINRSVLSHELKKMEKDELLTFKKNEFTLLDKCCPDSVKL